MLGKILGTDDGNIRVSSDGIDERTELGYPYGSFDGCGLLDGKVVGTIIVPTDGLDERTDLGSPYASFNSSDDGIPVS